jgi:dihydropteroate synthase
MPEKDLYPSIMGILNVTPDSFSDGGEFLSRETACKQGIQMVEDGANIVDIGGESTRPGSQAVSVERQCQRVIPVIENLSAALSGKAEISIDTTLSRVAEAALDAGATMINDISAGRDDSDMFALAADRQVPLVLMHMQGKPQDMQSNPRYDNVVKEIREFLLMRAESAQSAGVKLDNIILDPGIGFGKTLTHNMEILSNLDQFSTLGFQTLLGVSRKRFLQTILNSKDRSELAVATAMFTAIGIHSGIQIFRVHDVRQNRETADKVFKSLNIS